MDSEYLNRIFDIIESGECLPFIGAGAAARYNGKAGLPTGSALSIYLSQLCKYQPTDTWNLLRVAEYFEYTKSRQQLELTIQQQIQVGLQPCPIHHVLAQLPQIRLILTSNYDTLMEQALQQYGRRYRRHVHNPNNPETGIFPPPPPMSNDLVLLHKMHGSIDDADSMIITESDYIRYLANLNDLSRGMPAYFRQSIPQYHLLFLGYSLEDWNFRVIWEAVVSNRVTRNVPKDAFAIQKDVTRYRADYWLKRNIIILDADINDFAVELAKRFGVKIPQLGINTATAGGQTV